MNITCLGGVGEIGGNKILVEDDGTKVFLDFGRSMGKARKYYEEFIQIRSKSGLLDLLKLGILPKVDGVYPKHLLDITTLGSEVDAKSKLPWDKASDYWENDGIKPYDKEKGINGVFVSHVHFDHLQDVSFIHKDIPIFSTETTRVMAKAITDGFNKKVNPKILQRQARHSRIETTLMYDHTSDEMVKEYFNKVQRHKNTDNLKPEDKAKVWLDKLLSNEIDLKTFKTGIDVLLSRKHKGDDIGYA